MADQYIMKNIEIVSIEKSPTGVRIEFSTLMESAYFCPGVSVNREGDILIVSFVRCNVGDSCKVSHAIDPTQAPPYHVEIMGPASKVFLLDSDGRHRIDQ